MFAMQARPPSGRLKALALAVLLLAPTGALAASPDDDYVATRDRYIAELKTLEAPQDAPLHRLLQQKDSEDLEQRLKAMVGPFAVAGFPAEGKLNADLHRGDRSFGEIDGLAFGDKRFEDAVVVTTDALFDNWLQRHPRRWSKIAVPRAAAAAVRTDAFYTEALSDQGDFALYAAIPVVAPPGAKFAWATLATTWIGPEIPQTPDRLFVALEKAGRVFVVSVKPTTPMKGIAACDAVLATHESKAVAVENSTPAAGGANAQAEAAKGAQKLRDQGQAGLLSCFKDRFRTTPDFAAAKKQAAAIVEALTRN